MRIVVYNDKDDYSKGINDNKTAKIMISGIKLKGNPRVLSI